MFGRAILNLMLVGTICFAIVGCAPRGETDSLAGVLATAQKNFASAASLVADANLKDQVKTLAQNLDTMAANGASGENLAKASDAVAAQLNGLILKAGYTTRPALGEIIAQHRALSTDVVKGEVQSPRIKLLVARTYSLLASELETTKFSL